MSRMFKDEWVTIYHGDCREILSQLPGESVDLVLTDPPYNVGKDYGNGTQADRRNDYLPWLNSIWVEAGRVAKDGSFLIYTNTTTFIPYGMNPPPPWRYFHLAIWNKPLSLRPAFYGICPHWEPIFIALKGDKPWRPFRGDEIFSDVFSANVTFCKGRKRDHPAVKPVSLCERLILFGCPPNGTVLDPFVGTGTTLLAAKKFGCHAIGCDTSERFCKLSAKRCSQKVMFNEACADDQA